MTINKIVTKLKNLEPKQLNKLKQMILEKTQNQTSKQENLLLSKIKVLNNSQLNEQVTLEKIVTEINKLTNEEIKTIQKNIVHQINTKKTARKHNKANILKQNNQSNQKEVVKQNKQTQHSKYNQDIKLKADNKQPSKRAVKNAGVKFTGKELKDTSQIKTKNNTKDKLLFNNLEFKLKNEENSNKYKKVNNIKYFSKKQQNTGKENLTGFKNMDIKNHTSAKTTKNNFNNIIKKNNILNQIKDKVNIKNLNNKNQIEIKLKPDSLGKMKINLSMEANKIVGKILVENNAVQNYLENNLQELKNNLLSKGLQVDNFNIESENKNHNQNQNQNNQNSNNLFQQFKEGHDKNNNNNKSQRNVYDFFENSELTEEQIEEINKPSWRSQRLINNGFEYFA
ncbi:MAG TPA: flagellar hook-length control protein FliK [Halanaerobiales bacterium]|nr:flagellar hook-length control protein FliK [Halanaerobiales bacterium]